VGWGGVGAARAGNGRILTEQPSINDPCCAHAHLGPAPGQELPGTGKPAERAAGWQCDANTSGMKCQQPASQAARSEQCLSARPSPCIRQAHLPGLGHLLQLSPDPGRRTAAAGPCSALACRRCLVALWRRCWLWWRCDPGSTALAASGNSPLAATCFCRWPLITAAGACCLLLFTTCLQRQDLELQNVTSPHGHHPAVAQCMHPHKWRQRPTQAAQAVPDIR
jgi:hypothetical protein